MRFRAVVIPIAVLLCLLGSPAARAQINWPMQPFDQQAPIGNSYGEYQNYGGSAYLHPGIDVMKPAGTFVYAVKSGYVKAVLTTSASLHWRVAIGDLAGSVECDGWLYAHLEQSSIQVTEGEYVAAGQFLGELVYWPVAGFHHLHFVKIRRYGLTWNSDWDFVGNPMDELAVIDDVDPPEIIPVDLTQKFAFCVDNSSTYFAPGQALSGAVDIIARVHDAVVHPTWKLTPDQITYEIYNDVQATGEIVSFAFTGELFWDQNVDIIYRDDATYQTYGDYGSRIYYFIVTNTDGDSVVEASDAAGAWNTLDYPNGEYWVKVSAYDHGTGGVPNVTSDSVLVTVANLFTVAGYAIPCDLPPDRSGIVVVAPDMPGAPSTVTNSGGFFTLPEGVPDDSVYLTLSYPGYADCDTVILMPPAPYLPITLDVDYLVGDVNADSVYNVLDVVMLVNSVFRGMPIAFQPYWSGDLDYSRAFDVLDVVALIGHVFRGAPPPGPPQCVE